MRVNGVLREDMGHAKSKRKTTATSGPGNVMGRPGIDRSVRMVDNVRPGTRVLLRGIRVKGSAQTVDVKGYVASVHKGVATVETWGAIRRPIMMPVTGLTFYGGK